MRIFQGTDEWSYRDPACVQVDGTFYLFFTVSQKENGFMYNRVGMSVSRDLKTWSEPRLITEKNLYKNFCSPGNVTRVGDAYLLCISSYPMSFPYAQQHYADESARLYTMRTRDFVTFSEPELLNPKGNTPTEALGRMIDPFILPVQDGYRLFFKQNGVSFSRSRDLRHWEFMGNADFGENACVLRREHDWLLIHSPANGIGLATSHDLVTWEDAGVTPLGQSDWDWADSRITAGFAMDAPTGFPYRYLLFFHGSRNVFPETHGNASIALCFTDDFRTFAYAL